MQSLVSLAQAALKLSVFVQTDSDKPVKPQTLEGCEGATPNFK